MVDYTILKTQLRQKQTELGKQQIIKIPQMKLRMGIQGLPQRKEVANFNRRLRDQQKGYEKQIRAIDKYLLLKAEQDKIILGLSSSSGEDEEIPTYPAIPTPTTTFFEAPNLKRLRSRFKRKEKFI